jgi:predicted CXXCH cytochrome family protein
MKQSQLTKALVAGSTLVLSGSLFAQTMSVTPATNSVSPAGSIAPIVNTPGTTLMNAATTTTTGFSADPFQPGTSIKQTKHNLGRTNVVGSNFFDGTDEICVFCHTPHGGAGETSAAPLWNRKLAASTTYTTYTQTGSSTLEGTVAAVGSVSLACLSCHDGTQAMNANYNGPGAGAGAGYLASAAGGYNPASAPTAMNGTWSAFGVLNMPTEIAYIGTDLRNDHPIGIPFCGGTGGNPAAYTAGQVCNNDGFNQANVQSKTMNGIQVFWVETGAIGSGRQKEDFRLYPDNRSGTVVSAANVECASCHDPHTAANPTFLRVSNSASGVCLTCHNK